jgi:hypothetical protein
MKKPARILTVVLVLAWCVALGGTFEVCTTIPNDPVISDTCSVNDYDTACTGSCTEVVPHGNSYCPGGWSYCDADSYNVWYDFYDGTCDFNNGCGCSLPPFPTSGQYIKTGCMQPQ